MPGYRAKALLTHLLLFMLQLTLLQWSMQAVGSVLAAADTHAVTCHTDHTAPEAGQAQGADHDCCADHMNLDCQYHCTVGGFAFLGQALQQPGPSASDFFSLRLTTIPDPVSARTLFRPPRQFRV